MGRARCLIWLLFLSAGWLAAGPQGDIADSIAQYEYYPDGLTQTLTYANGVVSRYEYHDNAWLRSLESRTAAGDLVSRYEYVYDANGNRTEMREWNATPARRAADPMWAAAETLVIDPDLDENGLYCWATYLAYLQGAFSPSSESPSSSLADSNRLTYTGHEFDPATGLYYFKARFYDPEIGRFLSEDPYLGDAATPPSLHRFLYAYANPLRYSDPTGQWTVGNDPKSGRFYVQADSVDRTLESRSSGYSLGRLLDWYVFENEAEQQRFLTDVTKSNPWMIAENGGWNSQGLTTGKLLLPQGYQLSSAGKQAVLGWVYEKLPYWKKVGRETYVSEEAVLTLQWEMLKQAVMTVCDPLSWYQDANQINEDFQQYVGSPSRTQGAYLTADIAFALLPFVNAREGRIAREAMEGVGQAGRDARQVERLASREAENTFESLEKPLGQRLSPGPNSGVNPRITNRLEAWQAYKQSGGTMDRAHWVKATQRQYGGHSGGYPSGYSEWLRSVESTHGNAAQSTKTAYLYKLVDKDGNLLKWGITDSPAMRYPGKFMEGKDMIIIDQGSRSQILQKERHLVETDPGPLNFETWAGARVK